MALLQIDASTGAPRVFGTPQPLQTVLASALRQTPGPVTLLVHGYKYAPGHEIACPHQSLFAMKPRTRNPRVISWPRHLQASGLTIGFGWSGRGPLRQVYGAAAEAGGAIAEVVRLIRIVDPGRPVHILSHSMGARVALSALPHLPAGAVRTLLMLAAAEFRSVAAAQLATPAGRRADVWHVTSGENDLYDFLFERLIRAPQRGDRAIGTDPLPGLERIVLDDADTLARLDRLGFRIAPPARRFCHWSPYLRGGVFGLYGALIEGALCTDLLRAHLPSPERRRWSRVLARLPAPPALPIAGDASV